jgi:hypothetical protein
MDNETTTVGFFEPSEPRDTTARYLRTLGGAMMRADRHLEQGLAAWICGGCGDGGRYGWPWERPEPYRFATADEAWSAAQGQALAHAHTCPAPPRAAGGQTAPVIATRVGGDRGCDENPGGGREVTVDVDPRLPMVHQPLVELLETICENLVDLVAEHTRAQMPSIRIGVTTWWGLCRWQLAEAMAVAGCPRRRPGLRVYASCLRDALRWRTSGLAVALPDRAGGVTVLVNATAIRHCELSVRRVLLHELRHVAQLADPSHRALFVDQIRHDTRVQLRDKEWLRRVDRVLERNEAEAREAEDWTWAALNAHRAALDAEQQADLDRQAATDREQAERGNIRTACRWCDGEFYVPEDTPGPHSCTACRYKDGY